MMLSQKIKLGLPFIVLFALLALLWRALFYTHPNELPSALVGQTLPRFDLPNLLTPKQTFSQKDLVGQVSLLNVWATWCYACSIEHHMLIKIKNDYHIPIYSIVYKDDSKNAIDWLQKNGNPYVMTGEDRKGDVAIDLGVYGTPETFIINAKGQIIYRHVGMIDQTIWDNVLYPLIKKQSA